ncbi:UDP-N-acetylglucosamine 1-carboxyvinyltransferase [Candidatus Parcubacteria bacterium]|nr:UDP-N-acetylglucosamine 1-carboxyvinyltransferase [Candidatus Parcubacteria bacterium]
MTEKFIIQGGEKLEGTIDVRGSKNVTFPVLAATLLSKEECIISNIPLIEDVFRMIEILESMQVKIIWKGKRTLKINAKDLDPSKIKKEIVRKFRGSILLIGPLLARFGEVEFPHPGGCIIGARPIETHLDAFSQLGVEITPKAKTFKFKFKRENLTEDKEVVLNEFSVTATENIMLFASNLTKKVTIKIADSDYQIQELAKVLKKMGAKIKGAGTHTITIQGAKKLKGVKYKIIGDPIEAGTFILMAAAVKAPITVRNAELGYLEFFLKRLKVFGVPYEIIDKKTIKIKPWETLKIDKIQSLPYPGMPSDLQSAFGVLSTQAKGSTLIHDPLYEGRLKYLEGLIKMGADIIFADPHRAIVNGPSQLYGSDLGVFDLRGGAALIVAALIAEGESTINNVYQVDRGYERIEKRLQKLGAKIKRVKS